MKATLELLDVVFLIVWNNISVVKRPVGAILRAKGKENIEIDQLAMLPKEAALEMEYQLRPDVNLGWNVRAGGDRATVVCPVCGKPLPKRKKRYYMC